MQSNSIVYVIQNESTFVPRLKPLSDLYISMLIFVENARLATIFDSSRSLTEWHLHLHSFIYVYHSQIQVREQRSKWAVFLRSGQRCWVLLLTNNSQKTSWLTSKTTLVPLTTFKAYRYWVPFSFLVNWMHFLPPTDSILIPLIMEEENKIMNENMALNITFD